MGMGSILGPPIFKPVFPPRFPRRETCALFPPLAGTRRDFSRPHHSVPTPFPLTFRGGYERGNARFSACLSLFVPSSLSKVKENKKSTAPGFVGLGRGAGNADDNPTLNPRRMAVIGEMKPLPRLSPGAVWLEHGGRGR